jgi:flavin-dependent dehydrogenase
MDDVIVVGAGPAGSLAATILARAGLNVRLFDRAAFPRTKLCGDTLNPGACATLSRHLPLAPLLEMSRPIAGMLLTGPRGIRVRGEYGCGLEGRAIERRLLDDWLLSHAMRSGARAEQGVAVEEAIVDGGCVMGVRVRRGAGSATHPARFVIAADGRHSRLAFALGLARHPQRPRRWAIGAYFENVSDLSGVGEMHVRRGHYIGVAPLPNGVANACLVVPQERDGRGWRDAAAMLTSHLASDPMLKARFASARLVGAPAVLGPMAVDTRTCDVPGLLLAGDAAGFIDPMTGDGLTFALRGAELAAEVVVGVLEGTIDRARAARVLASQRRAAFHVKWSFNRALRRLVASPRGVSTAAAAARVWPRAFAAMIRYAGDA